MCALSSGGHLCLWREVVPGGCAQAGGILSFPSSDQVFKPREWMVGGRCLLMRQFSQAPEVVLGQLLLSVKETDPLSFYSSLGFSTLFSKVLSRTKRTDQPGSSLTLAVKRDSR